MLAFFCAFHRYDLSSLDNFLETYSEKDSPAFKELLINRLLARDGVKYLHDRKGERGVNVFGNNILVQPFTHNSILKYIQFILMRAREIKGFYPVAVTGEQFKESQSGKAKKSRVKVGDNGEALTEVIKELIKRHPNETSKELWSHFYSKLDQLGLCPKEIIVKGIPTYKYMFGERYRAICFKTFSNRVSKIKKSLTIAGLA